MRLGRSRVSGTRDEKVHARKEKQCIEPDLQASLTISVYFLNKAHNTCGVTQHLWLSVRSVAVIGLIFFKMGFRDETRLPRKRLV